jgi:sec-independent protein translocase protein TatA
MLFGMLGVPEVVIILIVVVLIFGPTKLPQLGTSVGKMLRGFKKELGEFSEESKKGAPLSKGENGEEIDVTPQQPSDPSNQKTTH